MIIKYAIMHAYEYNQESMLEAKKPLELTQGVTDYIESLLKKSMDSVKKQKAEFREIKDESNYIKNGIIALNGFLKVINDKSDMEEERIQDYQDATERKFIEFSGDISQKLFYLITKNDEIPKANILNVIFNHGPNTYYAILKLDYSPTLTHTPRQTATGVQYVDIGEFQEALPKQNATLKESMIINTNSLEIGIVSKSYMVDGFPEHYLQEEFLKCRALTYSQEANHKSLDRLIKQQIEQHYKEDNYKYFIAYQKALIECFNEHELVKIDEVAKKTFEDETIVEDIVKVYESSGRGLTFETDMEYISKKYATYKIKGDYMNIEVPVLKFDDEVKFLKCETEQYEEGYDYHDIVIRGIRLI